MKATANIPPPALKTISLEMSEADARLLFTILGGSNYQGTDFKPMYDSNFTKYGSVWDGTIGIRMYEALKPIVRSL